MILAGLAGRTGESVKTFAYKEKRADEMGRIIALHRDAIFWLPNLSGKFTVNLTSRGLHLHRFDLSIAVASLRGA